MKNWKTGVLVAIGPAQIGVVRDVSDAHGEGSGMRRKMVIRWMILFYCWSLWRLTSVTCGRFSLRQSFQSGLVSGNDPR